METTEIYIVLERGCLNKRKQNRIVNNVMIKVVGREIAVCIKNIAGAAKSVNRRDSKYLLFVILMFKILPKV